MYLELIRNLFTVLPISEICLIKSLKSLNDPIADINYVKN